MKIIIIPEIKPVSLNRRIKMNFKLKKTTHISVVIATVLATTALSTMANETNVTTVDEEKIEKITIYGRHNQLILESGTATKSSMSLMQTPAAIVVVDKLLISEQAGVTLQEGLRNISGLTQDGNNYGIGDNLAIRGLGVNYAYDGMYGGADIGNSYNPTRTMTNIESVEVLKGPATGLYGMGAAGGVINLIEKKPQQKEAYEIQAVIGQWDNLGLRVDATAGINDDTAYRVVANYEKSDGYRDLSSERTELYASLSHQISDGNAVLFSAAYIDDSVQIDSVGDPVRLLDLDLIDTAPGSITAVDLANDPTLNVDGDEYLGLQLTDAQRQELADSLESTVALAPYSLGGTGLISPISRPNEGKEFRVKVRQDIELMNDWSLNHQFQYRSYSTEFVRQTGSLNYVYTVNSNIINNEPRAPLVVDDVLYPLAARRQEYRQVEATEDTFQYFADLSQQWSAGDLHGEHLVSANYEKREMEYERSSIYDADGDGSLPYIYDITDPNWGTGTFNDYDPILKSKYDKSAAAWGFSLQEVVYFTSALTARIGGAYSGVKQTYQNQFSDGNPEYDADDAGVTYNLGLNYQFSDQIATFFNHSKGRTAYSVLGSLNGESDRPDSESESFDLGTRFTAFDEQLLASIVLFKTSRTNQRYTNPLYDDVDNNLVTQYYYDRSNDTEGVEVDLNLALNEQWTMNFNATYQEPVTTPGAYDDDQEIDYTKGIARESASIWTSYAYQFDVLPNPVKFSAGVTYEGDRTIDGYGNDYAVAEAYTVWDSAISYSDKDWTVKLNLRNLTDETYYSKAMFAGALPGESRNAKLTVSRSF